MMKKSFKYLYRFLLFSILITGFFCLSVSAAASLDTFQHISQYPVALSVLLLLIASLIACGFLGFSLHKKLLLLRNLNKDSLTGLLSERGFLKEAQKILETEACNLSIVSLDIDNFKYVNELYGYEVGTKLIVAVGEHFKTEFKLAKVIARTHADRFLLLIPSPEGANLLGVCGKQQCNHCLKHLADHILGERYALDLSVGIYHVEDKTLPLSYMIDCANYARSMGKHTYGRTYSLFTKAHEAALKKKNHVVQTMEQGIKNQEFKMRYQPKVDLRTEQTTGAEALVRWVKEDGTQIYPDQFIPLFERNGFIVKLDYYIFDAVCVFLKEHPELPKISINLSGRSLIEDGLLQTLKAIIERHGIVPQRIEIELTESAIVEYFHHASAKITALRALGFSISIDDFGTGVSSLHRLKELYVDVLKIDKGFLDTTTLQSRGAIIIESILHLSKQLGIQVVCEGVETQEQVQLLQKLGCDIAQGYYFAMPLSESDFLLWLKQEQQECVPS